MKKLTYGEFLNDYLKGDYYRTNKDYLKEAMEDGEFMVMNSDYKYFYTEFGMDMELTEGFDFADELYYYVLLDFNPDYTLNDFYSALDKLSNEEAKKHLKIFFEPYTEEDMDTIESWIRDFYDGIKKEKYLEQKKIYDSFVVSKKTADKIKKHTNELLFYLENYDLYILAKTVGQNYNYITIDD